MQGRPETDSPDRYEPRRQQDGGGCFAPRALFTAGLLGLLALLAAAGRWLPVGAYLVAFLEWAETLGCVGGLAVVGLYVLSCLLMAPGSVITLGAGALFGLFHGVLVASVGSTLGACAAFFAGRTVARSWVESRVAANRKFQAVDRAVGDAGFRVVLLLRLSPLFPFNVLNYGLGLTAVPFWKYAFASWLGMLPGTVMYVYLGTVVRSLTVVAAGVREATAAESAFFWAGLVLTVAATLYIARLARRAVARHGLARPDGS